MTRRAGGFDFTEGAAGYRTAPHSGIDPRSWNALIGVVTAVVGNILISFALNLQRYAHIRLHEEQLKRSQFRSQYTTNGRKRTEYGTLPETNGRGTEGDEPVSANNVAENEPLLEDASLSSRRNNRADSGASQLLIETYDDDDDDDDDDGGEQRSYLKSPYWWAGIILMSVGEAGNFLAYGFAPASIVSPLGVVALISNCIIAPCLLHETFRQRDFWGLLVAIAGAVTIVLSAKSDEKKMGPDEIWTAITRWEFELYLGITAGAILALTWASKKYGQRMILIDLGLVGLFGEYTALSTKALASLLSDSLWRVITFPITYFLAIILVGTALMQIRYINRALQRFPSTQVIPTQFVLFTLSVIVGSAVLYRDFESATPDQLGKFVGGCAMTFLGVYLITRGRAPPLDESEFQEADGAGRSISLRDEEAPRRLSFANPDIQRGDTAGSNIRPKAALNGKLKRQESQASGQSPPRIPHLDVSASSSPAFSRTVSGEGLMPLDDNPWALTPENLTPHGTLDRQSSYGLAGQDFSTSVPDRSSSLLPYATTPESRPQSLARRSMSRIFPKPLVTPLSSSLNGIVAESLRQGVDSPRRANRRSLGVVPRADFLATEGAEAVDRSEAGPVSRDASAPLLPSTLADGAADAERRVQGSHRSSRSFSESLRSLLQASRLRRGSKTDHSGYGTQRSEP